MNFKFPARFLFFTFIISAAYSDPLWVSRCDPLSAGTELQRGSPNGTTQLEEGKTKIFIPIASDCTEKNVCFYDYSFSLDKTASNSVFNPVMLLDYHVNTIMTTYPISSALSQGRFLAYVSNGGTNAGECFIFKTGVRGSVTIRSHGHFLPPLNAKKIGNIFYRDNS